MTRRLLLSYLSVTVLVLILLEIPLAVVYAQRERERVIADVGHDASVIATIYQDALESATPPDPRPAAAYAVRTGARVVVVDRAGISLVDTERSIDRDFATRPEIGLALAGTRASGIRPSETLGAELLYVAVPIASGGTVHGALRVTLDTSAVDARIHRLWFALGGVAAVVLGSVALIGWLVARSVTRPVRRLNDMAARFARGDLSVDDDPLDGPPELQALGDTMTTMALRIDDVLQTQRSFVGDASHQLRTPLTALRLRLENLQSRSTGEATTSRGAELGAELDAALDETGRLTTLVTDLLHLARADERPATQVADLARLAGDRVDTWTAVAESMGVVLRAVGIGEQAPVVAVAGAIEQILDNLIDNALAASPEGSTVTVTVAGASSGTLARLTVADQGPGLSADQLAHATRRFWRGDTTRPGTGLGLAIVDALVGASDGVLDLSVAPTGGLVVTVSFRSA